MASDCPAPHLDVPFCGGLPDDLVPGVGSGPKAGDLVVEVEDFGDSAKLGEAALVCVVDHMVEVEVEGEERPALGETRVGEWGHFSGLG